MNEVEQQATAELIQQFADFNRGDIVTRDGYQGLWHVVEFDKILILPHWESGRRPGIHIVYSIIKLKNDGSLSAVGGVAYQEDLDLVEQKK